MPMPGMGPSPAVVMPNAQEPVLPTMPIMNNNMGVVGGQPMNNPGMPNPNMMNVGPNQINNGQFNGF